MIKFFRRIRQTLLTGIPPSRTGRAGKFSKYILYAIGEIVLVVIGILIALQINSWNEERKESRLEDEQINVLIKDLKLKKRECMGDLAYGQSIILRTENIIQHWNNHKKIDATNLNYTLGKLGEDSWFYSENSALFIGLASSNLWKRMPDSLTTQIDIIYRLKLPQVGANFKKSSDYATHFKHYFQVPNGLTNLNSSAEEIKTKLADNHLEFISYLELLRSGVLRLNNSFESAALQIDKTIQNLYLYKTKKQK